MKNADHSNSVLQIKLLIVEDEKGLSVAVCDSLKSLGFQIDAAYTQEEALTCLLENDYGLIVLDLNLPDGSGLELLKWIRKEQNQTAVIILSARNSLDDKIAGLDLGADDYLTKPFHMAELNSRINAVIRRKFNLVEDKLIFKEIELNLSAREIRIKGKKIEFRNKEFDLLKFMIINKNQVDFKTHHCQSHLAGFAAYG